MRRIPAAGLGWTILTAFFSAAALTAYLLNTQTDYYIRFGISRAVIICLGIAILLCIFRIPMGWSGRAVLGDLIPICICISASAGLVFLLNIRLHAFVSVLTVEHTAANLSDTVSAFAAAGCTAAALLSGILGSFCNITKEQRVL